MRIRRHNPVRPRRSSGASLLSLLLLVGCGGGPTSSPDGGGPRDGGPTDARMPMADGRVTPPDGGGATDGGIFVGGRPGAPRVFYSDLDSAPAGSYVTLWGQGFGADRGASTALIGGSEAARYVSWSETRIEIALPDDLPNGPTTITVHTAAGDSPPLAFAIHTGRLLFVAPDGDDSWSGTREEVGGPDGPFRSITRGRDELRAGDVLYLRAATYTEEDAYNAVLALRDVPTGTAMQPVAIVAYPSEVVTLGDGSLPRGIALYRGDSGPALDHLTVAKLRFRASCSTIRVENGSYGRFVGNEISGATDACMSGTIAFVDWGEGVDGWRILGNDIHDNGATKFEHGIYLGGYGQNRDIEIAWNRIYEQLGGRAIQLFGHQADDVIENIQIHDNDIWNIDRDAIVLGATDADVLHLSNISIYNNVFYRGGLCAGRGVRVNNVTATGVRVFHNTFVDNGSGTRDCPEGGANVTEQLVVEAAVDVEISNNVFSGSGGEGMVRVDAGTVTGTNNLYTGSAPSFDAMPFTGDPLFVSDRDFRLQAGSPAIDHGVDLGLGFDHDGLMRPIGSAADIGAFEWTDGT